MMFAHVLGMRVSRLMMGEGPVVCLVFNGGGSDEEVNGMRKQVIGALCSERPHASSFRSCLTV